MTDASERKTNTTKILKLLAILLALISACVVLLIKVNLPGDSRVIYELQNSGHALIFCLITFVVIFLINRNFRSISSFTLCSYSALGLFIFGGLSEFIQPWFGRDSSWSDLLIDGLGIAAGVSLYHAYRNKTRLRFLYLICAGLLLLYGLKNPLFWYYAKHERDKNFPVLGDFENYFSSHYFEGSYGGRYSREKAPTAWKENNSMVARVEFAHRRWPGIQTFDLRGNWSAHEHLKFDVFNPLSEELTLVLRIHDIKHNNDHDDRFNLTLTIKPGAQTLSIATRDIASTRSGRDLQMGKIRVMMLYMPKPQKKITLYFDNFRLE